MSLFKQSFGLAKVYDSRYKNHQISINIFKNWGRDLHEFSQCQKNKFMFEEIINGPYFEKVSYFVNKYYKNQILKAICVLHIEKKNSFFIFNSVEREIVLFSKSFQDYLCGDNVYPKVKNFELHNAIISYIELFIISTTNRKKYLN